MTSIASRARCRAARTVSIPMAPPISGSRSAACPCSTCWTPRSSGPIAPDAKLVASIFTDSFQYPSVNIIGRVRGRDPALADQYVLFSAHQDHDGQRYMVDGDNIWNGADDNASTAVALLAIARAMSAAPWTTVGAVHLARIRGTRADGIALVREASDRAAHVDRGRAERRHDGPQRSEDGGAARRAATAPQLARTGATSHLRPTRRFPDSPSTRPGTTRTIPKAGTTAAITCRTRARACRRCSSRRSSTPITTHRPTIPTGSTSRNSRE